MYFLAVASIEPAQAAFDSGRLSEARTLLEARPADGQSQALLARVYAQLKLSQRALSAARLAERLGGTDAYVQHTLALFYAQSGQRKLAARWESRYARSPAADRAAPLRAALLHAEVRQWPEAIELGQLALAKGDRPEVRNLLARAYEATGKPDEAVVEYRALLSLVPNDESAHASSAQALLRMGRFNEAATLLEDVRRKLDRSPQIELASGVAYYAQRRFTDAGDRFLRVIELAPEVPQPYIFLARMMDQLPDRMPAILASAEAWHKVEGRNGFAPFVYAKALHASGAGDDKVKPLLLEALQRDGKVWEFYFELGQLLERERNLVGAARQYKSAIALNGQVPELHYRLSRVYERLGQPAKAARERAVHKRLQP